jgi:hypothetical protein
MCPSPPPQYYYYPPQGACECSVYAVSFPVLSSGFPSGISLCYTYQDDISVGSDTPFGHVEDLRRTLKMTRQAKLRMTLAQAGVWKKGGHGIRLSRVF